MTTTTEAHKLSRRFSALALLNTTMLLVHQIDAAFWHEWDMFHLPGGNQLNLVLNMPIVALVVYAYGAVFRDAGKSRFWLKINPVLGIVTLAVHSLFFIAGRAEFGQPVSLTIFGALALFSAMQLLELAARR